MKPSENVLEFGTKTPRGGGISIKSSTTAKKRIEDSDSQTPGLKLMKIQGLIKNNASDDEEPPRKKKP
jgi:hypothetical protein